MICACLNVVDVECRTDIELAPENATNEAYIANLVNQLIQEIENRAEGSNDAAEYFLAKLKLAEAAKMFRQRYR